LITLTVSDARRRLLAADLKLAIKANSPESADAIKASVLGADFSGALPPGASIGGINVLIDDPSKTTPAPSSQAEKSNLPLIIAAFIGSFVFVSLVAAVLFFYLRRRSLREKDIQLKGSTIGSPLVSAESGPPNLEEEVTDEDEADAQAETNQSPREPNWTDLKDTLSSMRFLSSDLVAASYAGPAPMEPITFEGQAAGGGLFNPDQFAHSNTVSVISLDQVEVEERLMMSADSPAPSSRQWRSNYKSSEAIRIAGRDEMARMRREDDIGATRPEASAGWGLNLLLPSIPWETGVARQSDQATGAHSTAHHSTSHPKTPASPAEISIDVPPSPDKSAPQSPLYGTAMSSMYGSASARSGPAGSVRSGVSGATSSRQAVKDRFKANLAKLQQLKDQS